jgi:hypothetical protein
MPAFGSVAEALDSLLEGDGSQRYQALHGNGLFSTARERCRPRNEAVGLAARPRTRRRIATDRLLSGASRVRR